MIRKYLKVLICLLLVLTCTTACFGKTKLNEKFDKDEMIELAKTVINEVHVNGVEPVITNRMREDYKAEYPLEEMVADFESLRVGLGSFMDYTQETIIGKNSQDEKEEPFAVIAITATYEKGEIVFMLTFDTDKNLVGFYMKK